MTLFSKLGSVPRVYVEFYFVGVGDKIGVFHGVKECLAENLDAVFRRAWRQHIVPRRWCHAVYRSVDSYFASSVFA